MSTADVSLPPAHARLVMMQNGSAWNMHLGTAMTFRELGQAPHQLHEVAVLPDVARQLTIEAVLLHLPLRHLRPIRNAADATSCSAKRLTAAMLALCV